MTPAELKSWRERLKVTPTDAARLIGCGRASWYRWEAGQSRIPKYIALACAAIVRGIAPWPL